MDKNLAKRAREVVERGRGYAGRSRTRKAPSLADQGVDKNLADRSRKAGELAKGTRGSKVKGARVDEKPTLADAAAFMSETAGATSETSEAAEDTR